MNSTRFRTTFLLISLLVFSGFATLPGKITVYLIGDSTMSIKQVKSYPETGWGMPFAYFFDESVTVDNRAQNGRSTRTFIEEKRWQSVVGNLHEGDYVFIQFGHNDEVSTKKSYTNEADFQANLIRFITESRAKKAVPVLITPVARRKFDDAGKIEGTHTVYSELVRTVAKEQTTPLIDLDTQSQQLLQQLGVEPSKFLFLHLAPDEHPNHPQGKEDDTHFSELGARRIAEIVLANIKSLKLDLADRIVRPESAK
ncbi:rhamnogalacturonan acetylesterase [Spirosoma sp. BT702]|uniref:Rhamnogalacturonan acetylesterase n=1 Tax=Spirosoma profusum TaxID=2771354 RepID=A0A926XYC0_9BACT|nr:rhamnogalacturonan acetylesterase [Spirosoma profusum]MBD2700068.1 rhamnogalacturonan acetylesterase [Spirosoma profusum]